MLVLARRRDEKITLDFSRVIDLIDSNPAAAKSALRRGAILLADIRGDKCRIGVDLSTEIVIHREEVMNAIDRENNEPDDDQRTDAA